MIETERLILRSWKDSDANVLYEYAKDPDVGPIAGWPAHKSVEVSLSVIQNVFISDECYAITLKGSDEAIGCIEIKSCDKSIVAKGLNECELGFWLAKPFWGNGYMPEAVNAIIQRSFNDLNMDSIWCGYYDGNHKSKRVQEKTGFKYHHTNNDVYNRLMDEHRVEHFTVLRKSEWLKKED